mgnify:CR=1 FL=1
MKHSFHGALKARGPSEGSVAGELRSETQAVGRESRKPQVGLPPHADKVSLNACGRVGHAVEEIGGLRSESPGARRRVMAQTSEKPPIRNRIRPARRTRGTRHAEAVVEHASLGVPGNRPGGARRRPRTEAEALVLSNGRFERSRRPQDRRFVPGLLRPGEERLHQSTPDPLPATDRLFRRASRIPQVPLRPPRSKGLPGRFRAASESRAQSLWRR